MTAIRARIRAEVQAALCGAKVTKEILASKEKLDKVINEVMAITGSVGD